MYCLISVLCTVSNYFSFLFIGISNLWIPVTLTTTRKGWRGMIAKVLL